MLRLVANEHMQDLVMAEETWSDIRPWCYPNLEKSSRARVLSPRFLASLELIEGGPLLERSKSLSAVRTQCPPTFEHCTSALPSFPSPMAQEIDEKDKPHKIKVYAGVNMSEQAHLWKSDTMDNVIVQACSRPIELAGEDAGTITFQTIFDMIIAHEPHNVYIYGGVLRDVFMKGPHVADDVDVLFTCEVSELIEWCKQRGWTEGQHYHLKRDEKTGKPRYDYISMGSGKEKFSGHRMDANCAGEFTFNCMLYDLRARVLIDATGWGVRDAVKKQLRIPYDGGREGQWDLWSQICDRLPGMTSLRFFNFRSRGFSASEAAIKHNVDWLAKFPQELTDPTIECFMKRKIVRRGYGGEEKTQQRLQTFYLQLVSDFDLVRGEGEGEAWWAERVQPAVDAQLAAVASTPASPESKAA